MAESWTWTYQDARGEALTGAHLVAAPFPTQSDAESWLGEHWRSLAEAGVAAVRLQCGDQPVYGPMALSDGS